MLLKKSQLTNCEDLSVNHQVVLYCFVGIVVIGSNC
ncbi:hypothetical protein CUMW_284870 [Citrus unshiu]|uniref:Uncharacterized protein n=1 Tax=Citrus unshiu TaxID=55188 RepID=A0A2H5N6M7_CITUN|nr:hypothetical protein CUMW_284870 [Citrus unshiu]